MNGDSASLGKDDGSNFEYGSDFMIVEDSSDSEGEESSEVSSIAIIVCMCVLPFVQYLLYVLGVQYIECYFFCILLAAGFRDVC